MTVEKQSLNKLISILEENSSNQTAMLFRNIFSVACYLSIQGENIAASKLLVSLFDWLGWGKRKTYFTDIQESLDQYSAEYASEISANVEISKLLESPCV